MISHLRYFILALFLFFFSANNVSAQLDVKLSPLGALLPIKDLVIAEYMPHKRIGIDSKLGISRRQLDGYNELAIDVTVVPKFYFFPKTKADRLYVGAWLRGGRQNFKSLTNALVFYDCTTFGVGFLLGYKHVWKSNFLFDFNIGPGHIFAQRFNFSLATPDFQRDSIIAISEALRFDNGILFDATITLAVGYRIFRKESKSKK